MRIAIIGTGISGMTCAYYLHKKADIEVFESGSYIGGHTNTVHCNTASGDYSVDTGFIVFNDRTYPNFVELLNELQVQSKTTRMGFSLRDDSQQLEYSGESLNGFFAQRINLFRPRIYGLIRSILRFNDESAAFLESGDDTVSLETYLRDNGYSDFFIESFILPMGAAIWSSSSNSMRDFPARFFIQFFQNHGFLDHRDPVVWRVIEGGSKSYIGPLTAGYRNRIHLNTPVQAVRQHDDGVEVVSDHGTSLFDHVIFACHSDQALAMLADPTDAEGDILGDMPYQKNTAVLHTDERVLPQNHRAWASWNFLRQDDDTLCVSYNMNILQTLDAEETFIVSLNASDIDPDRVIRTIDYMHPHFTVKSVAAQKRWSEVNGPTCRWYCGAYWRNGFHEDGVVSAKRVCAALEDLL